jgi:hypothetical protein
MEQATVMFLGALLIATGLAMWGARLGYFFFVVGVKTVIVIAAAVAAFGWYMSSAHAHTLPEFTSIYNSFVAEAGKEGIQPSRVCFPNYCANQVISWQEGDVLLSNITASDGLNTQEVCLT